MNDFSDPRLIATRQVVLDAALQILQGEGVLAVTHAKVSKMTGISRSTIYRHWPEVNQLRNDAFKRAASPPSISPKTNGPLRTDLAWLLGILMSALNETPWGQIAPQVIAAAATDEEARAVINDFMEERVPTVIAVFRAAEERGELSPGVPVEYLAQAAIAIPYFRKLIAGLPLDHDWLDSHVEMICRFAETSVADN